MKKRRGENSRTEGSLMRTGGGKARPPAKSIPLCLQQGWKMDSFFLSLSASSWRREATEGV